MNKLTPLIKGIITGAVMLILILILFYTKQSAGSSFQYLVYIVYAAGIMWTLFDYSRAEGYTGKFGDLFGQGFRCFIVTALIMVAFTGIFTAAHPEFAVEDAKNYREYLVKEDKSKTPAEIDELVANVKKHYTTGVVWSAVLGYLVIGSLFTAAGSVLFIIIRRK